ncbi:MAG: hypothetical protein KBE65_22935 [Phycisphaerae bacterium]|nr:hypothetical protein [Phycisphaerae bacterium]
MRVTRLAQHLLYVVMLSVLNSAVVMFAAEEFTFTSGMSDPRVAMAFVPMSLTIVPYAVLQVAMAAWVIRPLSLVRLFVVSGAFVLVTNLMSSFAMRSPSSVMQWMGLCLYSVLSPTFSLLLPLLILRFLGRRWPKRWSASPSRAQVGVVSDVPATQERRRQDTGGKAWQWYYWDVVLAMLPLWFGLVVDPYGLLSYLGGLINVPFALESLMMSVMLIPAALLCLVALFIRMLAIWPRHTRRWAPLLASWGIAVALLATVFVLPFLLGTCNPAGRYMSGFKRYVERRADIPAIQAWLATLNPTPHPEHGYPSDISVPDSDLPPSVRQLRPWYARVTLDDARRPMIRVEWGSGVMRSWGLVVGDKNMETPPSDFSRYGEYRLPLAPGAYVWREIR